METLEEIRSQMNDATASMIRGWVATEHGDTEAVARFLARLPGFVGIRQSRQLVEAAMMEVA